MQLDKRRLCENRQKHMRLPALVYAEARHRDRDGWCQVVINSEETIGSSGLRWRWGRRCAVNQSVLEDGHWAFGKLALGALSGGRGLAQLPQDAENQFWCVTLSQCHSSGSNLLRISDGNLSKKEPIFGTSGLLRASRVPCFFFKKSSDSDVCPCGAATLRLTCSSSFWKHAASFAASE